MKLLPVIHHGTPLVKLCYGVRQLPTVFSRLSYAFASCARAPLQLYMRVGEDGFCAFPDGTQRPRAEALKSGLGLVPGVNQVRFEVR